MSKKILYGADARLGVQSGIDKVANAVKTTLGYGGRTVIISDGEHPTRTTKDGVTVAYSISLSDPIENAGAKLIKEISGKTAADVGDGTTTVCVLLQQLVAEGIKHIASGANIVKIKSGMEKAAKEIVELIGKRSIPVTQDDVAILKQVATISANNDEEIGNIIGEVYEKLGVHGVIAIEDSYDETTSIELVNGFEFICGYINPYFATSENNTCVLENVYVMLVDGNVTRNDHVSGIMEQLARKKEKATLLLLADSVENIPLGVMLNNHLNKQFHSCPVKYNFMNGDTRDELMMDIAAVTGATLISEKKGMKIEKTTIDDLGWCAKVVISAKETLLIKGRRNEEEFEKRIQDANKKIEEARHPSLKERSEHRKASLQGGIAICRVGAITEVERSEKKDRIDDSIRATKAAMAEGIVPGGGTALIHCVDHLEEFEKTISDEDEKRGVKIVLSAIKAPASQIVKNAGFEFSEKDYNAMLSHGYNAKTGEIEDLVKAGIVDPAKVVRVCIENSVSGAGQVLLAEALIINEIKNN